jgi:hypothetical protein
MSKEKENIIEEWPLDKNARYNANNKIEAELRHRNKMEDEARAGIPSFDESKIIEYIRNRIEAPIRKVIPPKPQPKEKSGE